MSLLRHGFEKLPCCRMRRAAHSTIDPGLLTSLPPTPVRRQARTTSLSTVGSLGVGSILLHVCNATRSAKSAHGSSHLRLEPKPLCWQVLILESQHVDHKQWWARGLADFGFELRMWVNRYRPSLTRKTYPAHEHAGPTPAAHTVCDTISIQYSVIKSAGMM